MYAVQGSEVRQESEVFLLSVLEDGFRNSLNCG
jgi:hypothetical protein